MVVQISSPSIREAEEGEWQVPDQSGIYVHIRTHRHIHIIIHVYIVRFVTKYEICTHNRDRQAGRDRAQACKSSLSTLYTETVSSRATQIRSLPQGALLFREQTSQ